MYKFQSGGAIPEDIQVVALVIKAVASQKGQDIDDTTAIKQAQILKEKSPKAFQEAFQQGQQIIQQQTTQAVAAKRGAKLYIQKLRNQCAKDEEAQYFLDGGIVCHKCIKRKQYQNMTTEQPLSAIEQFKINIKK